MKISTSKKAAALLFAAVLAVSAIGFAGCAGQTEGTSSDTSSSSVEAVDTSKLKKLVEEAGKLVASADNETAAKSLSEVVQGAVTVMDDAAKGKATQADVDAAAKKLTNAIKAYKDAAGIRDEKKDSEKESTSLSPESADATPSEDGTQQGSPDNGGSGSWTEPDQGSSGSNGGGGGNGGNGGGGGNTGSSSGNSGSSTPTPSTPSAPAHTHNWVADTEQVWHANVVTVTDEPAWDEPTYENHTFCSSCGMDLTAAGVGVARHLDSCPSGGGGCYTNRVQTGSVHHDAVTHTEDQGYYETVTTGYHCSGCGATK